MNILQLICPTGFYGAEGWVLALANNMDTASVRCDMAVTMEPHQNQLEIVRQYPKAAGQALEIHTKGRFDLSAIKELCHIIKSRKIDIIHTHGYKSDILGFIASKITGIVCVSTPHGFGEPKDLKLKSYIKIGAFFLRFFDAVVPLSQQLRKECLDFGIDKRKIYYIKNGVDLKSIDPFLEDKINRGKSDRKIIGFIGQMIPRKHIDHILDIFSNLSKKHDNLELRLLGDGASREELERSASSLECSSKVKFLGFREDRFHELKNFDLFVMTSSSEGIPRCLMEALAMETPVAAYNIPGIDQLIEHNKTGLLADFGDKDKLQSYWEELLFDDEKSTNIAREGRLFVLNKFSANIMAKEYEKLFSNLLESKKSDGAKNK